MLAKAIDYMLKRYPAFGRFLDDGRICLSNNAAERAFRESVEHRASRIGGVLLFALAAYVVANAAYGLWRREGQEFSTPGLAIAVLAIPIMWWLARAKMRVAAQIGSRALRADAVESMP